MRPQPPKGSPADVLGVSGALFTPVHISLLLAVFTQPSLNSEWNTALTSQKVLYIPGVQALPGLEGGEVAGDRYGGGGPKAAHQVYRLPWPIANREFLLQCTESVVESASQFYSACRSLEHDTVPVGAGNVRGELSHSSWTFEASVDPPGTHIRFESWVDPKGSIPKPIVRAAQHFGKETLAKALIVYATAKRAKGRIEPLERYASWGAPLDEPGRKKRVTAAKEFGAAWAYVLKGNLVAAWSCAGRGVQRLVQKLVQVLTGKHIPAPPSTPTPKTYPRRRRRSPSAKTPKAAPRRKPPAVGSRGAAIGFLLTLLCVAITLTYMQPPTNGRARDGAEVAEQYRPLAVTDAGRSEGVPLDGSAAHARSMSATQPQPGRRGCLHSSSSDELPKA